MQKIKNFSTFINEDYGFGNFVKGAKKVLSSVSGWVSNIIKKIKDGIIPSIPDGDKSGLPMVGYFAHGEGSISDQMSQFFGGTDYAEVKESLNVDEGEISQHLAWPGEEGPLDVDAVKLKSMIKKRYKTLTTKSKIQRDDKESEVSGFSKPIFIFGAPGIGKTEIVAQAAEDLQLDVIFVDLQFMDPTDFLGVPTPKDVASDKPYGEGVTRGNPPVWLPRDNNGKNYQDERGGIIFFDELNRANLPVINGCMQLFQARRVQDYELPSNWLVVAAGNRPTDDVEEAVKEMPTAFWDRVSAVNYVPSVEGFVQHVTGVTKKGEKTPSYDYVPSGGSGASLREIVLPELLAFLQFSREYFHSLDPDKVQSGRKYATPRGWVDASKSLYSELKVIQAETGKKEISADEVFEIFAAEVGQTAARAFLEFYNIVKTFDPKDVDKVFNEPEKAPIPKSGDKPSDIWAKLAAVVSKSGDLGKLTSDQYGNAIKWSIRLKETLGDLAFEYATAFVHMLNSKHDYVKSGPNAKPYIRHLNEFAKGYHLEDFDEFRQQK